MNSIKSVQYLIVATVIVLLSACSTSLPASTPTPSLPASTPTPSLPASTPTPYDELATPDDRRRLEFFRNGGIWSFRTNSETESEWIIVILAQKSALDNKPEINLGGTYISISEGVSYEVAPDGSAELTVSTAPHKQSDRQEVSDEVALNGSLKVFELYAADQETWNSFVRLYADGIERGEFDAFLVKTAPLEGNENVPISAAVELTRDVFLEEFIK